MTTGAPLIETPHPRRSALIALLLAPLVELACADDTTVTPTGSDGTFTSQGSVDTTASLPMTTSGVDTTESASASGGSSADSTGSTSSASTGDTTDTEGTTGDMVSPGQTVRQLVSAGTRTSSRSYTLVHTLGQPSPLQSTHVSPGYTLHGGLVGANGSPP